MPQLMCHGTTTTSPRSTRFHVVTDFLDLGDALVPDREWRFERRPSRKNAAIEVAGG